MNAPRAAVVVDGEPGPLRQKLREAAGYMVGFKNEASAAMGGAVSAIDNLRNRLLGLLAVISSGAFVAFARQQIDVQDALGDSAERAGVAVEQFSGLAYASRFADLSTEDLEKTYAKLSGTLTDALQGQKQSVELMSRLKLDTKNFKDADQLLMAIADRFQRMPDGIAKTSLAVDVFGEKLGPRLLPLLNLGQEGIRELREEAERMGLVVDAETARAAGAFNDHMDRIGGAAEGAARQIAASLLPALEAVAENIAKGATQGTSGTIFSFIG